MTKHDRSCFFWDMAKRAPKTNERILQEGLALMSQEGLAGVTIGRLAEQVGMSKSGLFAHFRSKEDIQVGLLEYAGQFFLPRVLEPAMKAPEGLPRLESLVQHWLGWAKRAGLPGGCAVAAAMFELDDVESPVREYVLGVEARWRAMLGQFVQQAVDLGHLRAGLDVEQFVWELCGIYLSHHTLSRFVRDPRADERARVAFEALVNRARPGK